MGVLILPMKSELEEPILWINHFWTKVEFLWVMAVEPRSLPIPMLMPLLVKRNLLVQVILVFTSTLMVNMFFLSTFTLALVVILEEVWDRGSCCGMLKVGRF